MHLVLFCYDKGMKKDNVFYQSKFEYYRTINLAVVIICSLSSLSYLISDWYIFGRIDLSTVAPRSIVFIPMVLFLIVNHLVRDYRVIVPLSYLVAHGIMWSTIGACYYLPDLSFASDGFIIIMAIFIFFGFAAPWKWSVFFTGLLFVDIWIADSFLHYPDFAMMIVLGVPFYFAIGLMDWIVEHSYVGKYETNLILSESALHDQLTGCYNRNILEKLVNTENDSFTCFEGRPVSVMIFDIDFFKKVNDTYGHVGGDVVLKEVVSIAKEQLDIENYMLRWGGEEFLIIVPEDLEHAKARAEEIRLAIARKSYKICKVTVSVGVTLYKEEDYKVAVQRADSALYRAKNLGRNRVEVDES